MVDRTAKYSIAAAADLPDPANVPNLIGNISTEKCPKTEAVVVVYESHESYNMLVYSHMHIGN